MLFEEEYETVVVDGCIGSSGRDIYFKLSDLAQRNCLAMLEVVCGIRVKPQSCAQAPQNSGIDH